MAKIIASFFFLTALAFPNLARAKNDPQLREAVLKSFRQHCENLAREGIGSVAGLPVAAIIAKSESIEIDFTESVNVKDPAAGGAVRTTAYWDPKSQTLSIAEAHARTSDVSGVGGILLHEIFRAVGIDDDNYDASSVLNAYMRVRKLNAEGQIYLKNPKSLEILRSHILEGSGFSRRNGISGVGGGGDIGTELIKEALIAELLFDLDEDVINGRQFIFAINLLTELRFENSPNISYGQFEFSSDRKTVVVPMNPLSLSNNAKTWQTIITPFRELLIKFARTRIGK